MIEITYCPKCHQEGYRVKRGEKGVEVIQKGKTVFKLSRQSSVDLSLKCPKGHSVKLVLKGEGIPPTAGDCTSGG
jgi:hypothetical protein